MPESFFVYHVAGVDEVEFNEHNPSGSVTILFKAADGSLVGIRLEPTAFAELETVIEGVREKLRSAQGRQ